MTKKKRIDLRRAKPGMVLAAPVLSETGRVIINEDVALTEAMLQNLSAWQIHSLSIWEEETLPKQFSVSHFAGEYENTVQLVDGAFASMRFCGELPLAEIQQTVVGSVLQMTDTIGAMHHLQAMRRLGEYTIHHSVGVSVICGVLGKWMEYEGTALRDLVLAGLLHDIGKTQVPEELLAKPDKLTAEEMAQMQRHSALAIELLRKTETATMDVVLAILQHHERMDGSGYPNGLRGDQIHPYARILAVADLYDAVTNERPFQQRTSPFGAARLIAGDMYDKLDTATSATFLEHLRDYFTGCQVRLSDGRLAEVVMIGRDYTFQPVVKTQDGKFIDIGRTPGLTISQLAGA